jgi:D-threonate/D-erythronate kinase
MIAVIADDLSGAAELAGIAAKHGYRAEVHTVFDPSTDAEIVAIDTDTRWRPVAEAQKIVAAATTAVLALAPEWIFKKTDSVLRGHVRAEIEAILQITGQRRTLLVPANPSKARVIRGGIYFINNVPLAESDFARDPEHPCRTSNVADLLAIGNLQDRLFVPDVDHVDDVATHASEVDSDTLPAGGADFFEAVLKAKNKIRAPALSEAVPFTLKGSTLIVCGSAAAWDNGRASDCAAMGIPVIPMPQQIFTGDVTSAAMHEWCAAAWTALHNHGRAMLTIGRHSTDRSTLAPRQLADRLAQAVVAIVTNHKIEWLALEGGSTAAAILRQLGWTRLTAFPAELIGVAALSPASGPSLLIKPGSYPWPRDVFARAL